MISIFGIVSFVVAAICIIVILQQGRVMRRRAPVDQGLRDLEVLVRQRLELIQSLALPDTELYVLIEQCIDKDLDTILESIPDIEAAIDIHSDELTANTDTLSTTISTLNSSIDSYNNYITTNSTGVMMAILLGIDKLQPINLFQHEEHIITHPQHTKEAQV